MSDSTTYERFLERYLSGELPWDDHVPPPEVVELAAQLEPARALDLGCGYGRTAIYLAQSGWHVDGIDFVQQAITEARRRAREAGVAQEALFHKASITDLDFLSEPYELAIDVGCMHVLSEEGLERYAQGLRRLLKPQACYLLFVHLRHEPDEEEDRPRGIEEQKIFQLFADGFVLERVERGVTKVEDKPPWHSAWYWFRRSSAG